MSTVNPSQSNAGDLITANAINGPINQLATVINGGIDATNITDGSITSSEMANKSIPATKVDFGGSGSGVWWEEIGRTTLSVAAATMSVTSLPARRYLRVIVLATGTGTTSEYMQFNGDAGSNYAWRYSVNTGAETANAAVANWGWGGDPAQTGWLDCTILNIGALPKLGHGHRDITSTTGASLPNRVEFSGKWNNTSSQIARIDYTTATSTFAIGSELIVLGHD